MININIIASCGSLTVDLGPSLQDNAERLQGRKASFGEGSWIHS